MRSDALELATPPMWEDKTRGEVRQLVTALIEEQATELQRERARRRKGVVGPKEIKRARFRRIPKSPKRTPRVKCLCADAEKRKAYLEERMETVAAYKRAMDRWRKGYSDVSFPTGTHPPGWCRCA